MKTGKVLTATGTKTVFCRKIPDAGAISRTAKLSN